MEQKSQVGQKINFIWKRKSFYINDGNFYVKKKYGQKIFIPKAAFLFLSTRFFYDFHFMGKLIFSELTFSVQTKMHL